MKPGDASFDKVIWYRAGIVNFEFGSDLDGKQTCSPTASHRNVL